MTKDEAETLTGFPIRLIRLRQGWIAERATLSALNASGRTRSGALENLVLLARAERDPHE